ncbi:MAG: YccF domain-containing protein [Gordonia sp. (in: high G+C Gram-positive bacteria)]|uniref:YccF domain-containing protein n=1 Tax=Gordonia sp. (in: high G+C Gram-positive bacteria) TaxID=84139 RepID=UPI003BB6C112
MKTILNILWLVLCGLWMAIGYAVAGVICFILIITIPFGIASFRMANYALWPFGRTIIRSPGSGTPSMLGNIIWLIVAGIWLAIGHITTGLALCVTIIGIPLGIASFKMVPVSLLPLGAQIVATDDPRAAPASPAMQ